MAEILRFALDTDQTMTTTAWARTGLDAGRDHDWTRTTSIVGATLGR